MAAQGTAAGGVAEGNAAVKRVQGTLMSVLSMFGMCVGLDAPVSAGTPRH
jgi:hypothetical protein